MFYFDALVIYAYDGMGTPTSYVNTAIGLPAGGIMSLITGRPGLNGTKTLTGDPVPHTTFYEDLLAENAGDFLPSRSADFVDGGCIESISTLSFTFLNTNNIVNLLQANGVYLARCTVVYFRVTSADMLSFAFEQRFIGVIDDQPYNELSNQFQCVSSVKSVLKSNPKIPVNLETYPQAPKASLDKFIPQAFGRVAYAPMINVHGSGEKVNLVSSGGTLYTVAACNGAFGNSPQMKTNGIKFLKGDPRLVDKFLSVIQGGTVQAIRILDVLATDASDPFNYYTFFILAENLTGVITPWTVGPRAVSDPQVTYFEVVDLAPTLLIADSGISQIRRNNQGREALSIWDSGTEVYDDVSEMQLKNSAANIAATGLPGFLAVAKSANQSGELINYFSIRPQDIKRSAVSTFTTDLPSVAGSSCPLLFDGTDGTYYTFSTSSIEGHIILDVYFPSDNSLKQFAELYLVFDMAQFYASSNPDHAGNTSRIRATIEAFDLYGGAADIVDEQDIWFNDIGATGPTGDELDIIPRSYFNASGNVVSDANFYSKKAILNVASLINSTKSSSAFIKLRLDLRVNMSGRSVYTLLLKEIAIIGKRAVSVSSESLYATVIGQTYGSTWNGRRGPSDPVSNPVDLIEKLIRDKDVEGDPWQALTDFAVGDRCRSTADNGHIFRCTTAGTTGSTQPTWTATAGAAYTDGSVVWHEVLTIPINEAAFDTAATQRSFWGIGWSNLDVKPTEDLIRMICEHSFLVFLTDRFGYFKVKAWRENETPLAAFDKTNIYKDSLNGGLKPSAMRRVRNTLSIQYDWSPGPKKYNRRIVIKNTDKPAFPSPSEVLQTGTSLGVFSATYTVLEGSLYSLEFATTLAHQMATGDYAMLTGNAEGYNFPPMPIYKVDDFNFHVLVFDVVPTIEPSTSGTLLKLTNRRLKWKEYVSGYLSYAYAKRDWDKCHAGFLISKSLEPLPDNLGTCPEFFDPYATDAQGALLWPDLDVGDEHSAVYLATNFAEWSPRQKPQGILEVVDDGAFSSLEIADPVTLQDVSLTNDRVDLAWIHEITFLAKTAEDPARIRFGLTFNPIGISTTGDIIDEEGATDIIDEETASDIVDEEF